VLGEFPEIGVGEADCDGGVAGSLGRSRYKG
jgi:hypothetical protein